MRWLLLTGIGALAVGIVGLAGTSMALTNIGYTPGGMSLDAMMGGDPGKMMGSIMSGLAPSYVQEAEARALGDEVPDGAVVDRAANRLTFNSSAVHLVMLSSPAGGRDMTFRIAGLDNPTIVVPHGAVVSLQFINGDADTSHGWELITGRSSFGYMAMMDGSPVFPGSFGMPLGSASASGWPAETLSFTASTSGTYTYICPVVGHAQKGMHGQLVVG